MKKILCFLLFVSLKNCPVFAQEIQINEPPLVTKMVERWAEINRTDPAIEGWRVQLFSSTDRKKVEEAKTAFLTNYPTIPCDWVQEKPYYKLRAGAFSTKLETMRLIRDLQADYPAAYATKDRAIHPRDFVEMQ